MKNTLKKTLGIVLALALTLTAIGCGVVYADSYRGERTHAPITVEKPAKAETVISDTPAVPTADKPTVPNTNSPAATAPSASASTNTPAAPQTPSTPAAKDLIGKDKAEALARESLGISDLHLSGVELDDGRYELEFCSGTTEYNVDVHPTSGKILKSEIDHHDECDRCDTVEVSLPDNAWDDRYDDWDDHYDDWDDRYDDWDDRYDDDRDDRYDDWDDRYDD